jgi:hypothetical protein
MSDGSFHGSDGNFRVGCITGCTDHRNDNFLAHAVVSGGNG